ncbi:MAG: methyltransferase domain-containing protein [Geobacteraceae bacterium]|nr:methyltransferase domain-containing protein [Geobacteraceae bacterium]
MKASSNESMCSRASQLIDKIKRNYFPGSSFVGPYEKKGLVHSVFEEQWLWKYRSLIKGTVLDMSTPRYWHDYLYDLPDVSRIIISDLSDKIITKGEYSSPVDIVGDFCAVPPPLPEYSVDTILCSSILEHCEDPFQMMKNLASIVRPGGFVLVMCPYAYIDGHMERDYWRFGKDAYDLLAKLAGLEIIETGQYGDLGKYYLQEFGWDASSDGQHRGIPQSNWIICRRPPEKAKFLEFPFGSALKLYDGLLPSEHESEGWKGISKTPGDYRHICHDITKPFPFEDNSVEVFQSEDVFVQIHSSLLLNIINEIHRVLKPSGLFRLIVPDYGCELLRERALKNESGVICSDPFFHCSADHGEQTWFPRIDTLYDLLSRSLFSTEGTMKFLQYWNIDRSSFVMHPIDHSKGLTINAAWYTDSRKPWMQVPMSIIVDLEKS